MRYFRFSLGYFRYRDLDRLPIGKGDPSNIAPIGDEARHKLSFDTTLWESLFRFNAFVSAPQGIATRRYSDVFAVINCIE